MERPSETSVNLPAQIAYAQDTLERVETQMMVKQAETDQLRAAHDALQQENAQLRATLAEKDEQLAQAQQLNIQLQRSLTHHRNFLGGVGSEVALGGIVLELFRARRDRRNNDALHRQTQEQARERKKALKERAKKLGFPGVTITEAEGVTSDILDTQNLLQNVLSIVRDGKNVARIKTDKPLLPPLQGKIHRTQPDGATTEVMEDLPEVYGYYVTQSAHLAGKKAKPTSVHVKRVMTYEDGILGFAQLEVQTDKGVNTIRIYQRPEDMVYDAFLEASHKSHLSSTLDVWFNGRKLVLHDVTRESLITALNTPSLMREIALQIRKFPHLYADRGVIAVSLQNEPIPFDKNFAPLAIHSADVGVYAYSIQPEDLQSAIRTRYHAYSEDEGVPSQFTVSLNGKIIHIYHTNALKFGVDWSLLTQKINTFDEIEFNASSGKIEARKR